MKTKLMWIPFIPLFAAGVLLKVYQALFDPKGVDVGLVGGGAITLGFAAIIIITFVVLGVMSWLDKRTSAFYEVKKNVPAGLCAIIAGAFVLAGTAASALNGVTISVVIDILMSLVGGIAIIVMGISSLSGNNKAKNMPALIVMTALWGFARTFITFLGDTTISSESRDMSDLVVMVFATMFLFNCSMVYLNIKGRNAVKGCFLYGMPTILVSTAYTLSHTIADLKNGTFNFIENVEMYEFFAIALFALFFLIELSYGAKERSLKEYEDAGISPDKFKDAPEETEAEVDPEELIELSDDPLMLQAEETMKSVGGDMFGKSEKYGSTSDGDDKSENPEQTDISEQTDIGSSDYEPDPGCSDGEDDNGSDIQADSEAESAAEPEESAGDYEDIDLDSINRLISELTGE